MNARAKVLRFMGVDEAPAPPPALFADPLTERKGTEWARLGTGGWQKRALWNERDEDA
jgi:hypothetical protein